MSDPSPVFSRPLARDPAVALADLALPPPSPPGPVHRAQFVIEMVGPRTMPAPTAKACLDPRWVAALGNPEVFVMGVADTQWRVLNLADTCTSYDSLAFTWDFLAPGGTLSNASAAALLAKAESFAAGLGRRAMPLPPPPDVDATVSHLEEAADHLDIGLGLTLLPRGDGIAEEAVWTICAALGMDLGAAGLFEWSIKGWPEPILTLSSLGDCETFSLAAVRAGVVHPGLAVGFRVARSPNPRGALESCLRVAECFRSRAGMVALDDQDEPLSPATISRLEDCMAQAERALAGVGLAAGSPAALKVFR